VKWWNILFIFWNAKNNSKPDKQDQTTSSLIQKSDFYNLFLFTIFDLEFIVVSGSIEISVGDDGTIGAAAVRVVTAEPEKKNESRLH
jgi:hypothetical protein